MSEHKEEIPESQRPDKTKAEIEAIGKEIIDLMRVKHAMNLKDALMMMMALAKSIKAAFLLGALFDTLEKTALDVAIDPDKETPQ